MMTALIRNWRPENEALILAPTIEVAGNSFGPAKGMVNADPELQTLFHVQDNIKRITHRGTDAKLKIVAAENETAAGTKAAFLLVDELWLFGKRPSAEAILMEAAGGLVSRPEGFRIDLSTQSDEPPAGVFKERLELFRDIRDGKVVDPKKLGVLYEYPEPMLRAEAYLDPANFYVTNPNIDLSVRHDWLVRKLEENRRKTPEAFRVWVSKHLNVEIGMRLRADRWPGADHWEASTDKTITSLQALLDRCDVVVLGGDGGGLDDLLGLAVLGREKGTRRWLLWCHGWCYAKVLERRKDIATKLRDCEARGEITICETLGDDLKAVTDIARQVRASGKCPARNAVGLDPAGLGGLKDAIALAGFNDDQIGGVSQGWKLAGAITTTERALADGSMVHAAQDLMTFCVGNAKVEPKGNAKLITKAASGSAKIDPLMATFNAVTLMSLMPKAPGAASITLL